MYIHVVHIQTGGCVYALPAMNTKLVLFNKNIKWVCIVRLLCAERDWEVMWRSVVTAAVLLLAVPVCARVRISTTSAPPFLATGTV